MMDDVRWRSRAMAAVATPLDDDVLAGLAASPRRLPTRLLYDTAGAALFDQICGLDAYYPTRTELGLLDAYLPQIAAHVGSHARVIEPGSGAGVKTQRLLRALREPAVYVPIDVCADQLADTADRLAALGLEVLPVVADYTRAFALPAARHGFARTLVFFPGSTIGNFEPADARAFLARLGRLAGPDRLLLLGTDGTRDPAALLRAYDDEHGVTAAFDKNALAHLNRTRGATFQLDAFEHRAVWNAAASRVEMHLVSRRRQEVRVDDRCFELAAGEPIVTEHCYKHTPAAMQMLLAGAGWRARETFAATAHAIRLWLCEPIRG
jgi:dimethylhistidine N-methyltransferase